ncbi:MAG: thioredoxin family protein [Bacilli bacterium]|nr:thioredoxin family protein [Bacilli bacterium]
MKKVITLIGLIFIILLLTGCNDNKYLKEISLDELYTKTENKETFILELTQDGCSHCAAFAPTFKKVLKDYKITAYNLNISNMSEEEYFKFIEDFNNNESLGTPTVMFFVNGHEKTAMNRIIGSASEKEVIRKLTQNDYIKE